MKSNVSLWDQIRNQLPSVALAIPFSLFLLWLILGDEFFNPMTSISVMIALPFAIYVGILYDKLIRKIT